MPEGDTILRAARMLERTVGGQVVTRFEAQIVHEPLEGEKITSVEARGKYLLVRFESGRVLLTHMKMTGSWRVYRRGSRARGTPWRARAVIETASWIAVCFDAPIVRLLTGRAAERVLLQLGPDVLSDDFDARAAVGRIRAEPRLEVGDAIMLQRLVAGIGNIYKSESLFCARVHPRTRVADMSDVELARVLAEARRLMRANVQGAPGRRRTHGGKDPHWVYGRAGLPCHRCKTPVARIYQGSREARRSTYLCPTCQPTARGEVERPDGGS